MTDQLDEEQMRLALLGEAAAAPGAPKARAKPKVSRSPKMRVTLQVSREFEGATEMFVYEASTLSTLVAQQQAQAEARKKKFKYFEVVSTLQI